MLLNCYELLLTGSKEVSLLILQLFFTSGISELT